MSDQHIHRPAAVPFDSEIAQRGDAPRTRAERVVSAVAYHAGPELAVTAAVGGVGGLVVHPAVFPAVAALASLYAVAGWITRYRANKQARPAADRPAQDTPAAEAAERADAAAEGVA